MKMLLPDAFWHPDQISGALFLYFHDEEIGFTLHPSVSYFLTGINPYSFLDYLEKQNPKWKNEFLKFFNIWQYYQNGLQKTHNILKSFQGLSHKIIWLSYPRGTSAWESAGDLIESLPLEIGEIYTLIDPFHAADEFFSHLFCEKVLETKYSNDIQPDIVKEAIIANNQEIELRDDFDWIPIYKYCEELFQLYSLDHLLTKAYMFRIPVMNSKSMEILLSNENLIKLLASLPISHEKGESDDEAIPFDIIAWEFFRQLLSPYIDPIDDQKVKILQEYVKNRSDEIERLRNKCYELSIDLSSEKNLDKLIEKVAQHIRGKVINDLKDLLQIDKTSFNKLLIEVFSDQKTWAGIAAFLYSIINGGEALTAASAIFALSNFGAKAFKQAHDRNKKLQSNAYTLIYRMKNS